MGEIINLLPARVAIGRVTPSGDVLQTREFSNAFNDLLGRVGGTSGMGIADIIKELARRPSTLAQSSIPATLTGKTDAQVMATVKVPANAMGPSGMVRITTTWSVTNNENEKTIITRFGGSDTSKNAVTTVSTYQDMQCIQNRGPNAQVFVFGGFSYTGSSIATLAMNTSSEQAIEIVAQLADPADSVTLEAYTVELIPTP